MSSINAPWSHHVLHPSAHSHSRCSTPASPFSIHSSDELQIRSFHSLILLATLRKSCEAVQQLRDCGQLPVSISLHDWIDLSRKQDDIRESLEKLQQEVQFLANESKASVWIAEDKPGRSGLVVGEHNWTEHDHDGDTT
jgi:hypothetical protein